MFQIAMRRFYYGDLDCGVWVWAGFGSCCVGVACGCGLGSRAMQFGFGLGLGFALGMLMVGWSWVWVPCLCVPWWVGFGFLKNPNKFDFFGVKKKTLGFGSGGFFYYWILLNLVPFGFWKQGITQI